MCIRLVNPRTARSSAVPVLLEQAGHFEDRLKKPKDLQSSFEGLSACLSHNLQFQYQALAGLLVLRRWKVYL